MEIKPFIFSHKEAVRVIDNATMEALKAKTTLTKREQEIYLKLFKRYHSGN